MTIRAEQPQSIGGVLDSTFRLFRGTFRAAWPLALIGMLVWIPAGILFVSAVATGSLATLEALALSWRLWGSLLAAVLISFWCYAAQLWRMDAIAREAPISLVEGLMRSLPKLPTVLFASILYGLLMFIAALFAGVIIGAIDPTSVWVRLGLFVVLLIPALVVYVSYYFYFPAIAVDGMGPFRSLGRSRSLVKGNWFRSAALLTVGLILWSVLYIAISLLGGLVALPFQDLLLNAIVSQVSTLVLASLIMPFLPALSLAIYYDLRLRREGTDLLARVEAVGAT